MQMSLIIHFWLENVVDCFVFLAGQKKLEILFIRTLSTLRQQRFRLVIEQSEMQGKKWNRTFTNGSIDSNESFPNGSIRQFQFE